MRIKNYITQMADEILSIWEGHYFRQGADTMWAKKDNIRKSGKSKRARWVPQLLLQQ